MKHLGTPEELLIGWCSCPTSGEPGDRVQFSEFIMANVRLYALRHDRDLSTHAVANFTRSELATALRKVLGTCYICLIGVGHMYCMRTQLHWLC